MYRKVVRATRLSLSALFLAALFGCSDDKAPQNDAGTGDGAPQADGAAVSVLRFESASFEASELDAEAEITVILQGRAAGEVSVEYATADDTARAKEDYEQTTGTLTWADGESGERRFTVPLSPDLISSADKQLELTLGAVTGAAKLGEPKTATLTLRNATCEKLSEDFSSDTTLSGRCYLVTDRLSVDSAATLTISAGVTLIFQQDTRINVQTESRLLAEGTAEEPIRFTGEQQTPGYWQGLVFSAGELAPASKLAHATVEHAGSDAYQPGNVAVLYRSKIAIDDCTFTKSAKHGVWISDEAVIESFTGNRITANEGPPVFIYASTAGQLDASSTYRGNADDVVIVANYGSHANVRDDQTWKALDVPYLVTEPVGVSAHLTVEAGATVRFDENSKLTILADGALTAIGTDEKPILLTGKQQTPGYWVGLFFSDSNDVNNKLRYVTIEHGGSDSYHPANLVLLDRTRATIDDCTFRKSKSLGFWLSDVVLVDSFKNNTSTENQGAAGRVYASSAGRLDETLKAQGNTEDHVILANYGSHADVAAAQTWPAIDVPYLVTESVGVRAHLTIQAGATLIWAKDTKLSVSDGGALTAVGSAREPVTFTSADEAAGSWAGIFIWTNDVNNRLEQTVLEHGGADPYQPANLVVRGTGSASLKDSQIRESSGHGVWIDADASLEQSGNSFSGIALEEVHKVQP